MGKLIEFYIPEGFRSKRKWDDTLETSRVIEFPSSRSDRFQQVAWVVPEVDADLA